MANITSKINATLSGVKDPAIQNRLMMVRDSYHQPLRSVAASYGCTHGKVGMIGLLIAVLLIAGCYGTQTTTPTPTATEQVQPTGELKEFTVESSEFKFNPSSITVNKGDRVKVTFRNVGSTGHNFVIADLGVSTRVISAGSTETVEFTADKSGTFDFYCSVPGHRAAGMEGQISIS